MNSNRINNVPNLRIPTLPPYFYCFGPIHIWESVTLWEPDFFKSF